MNKDYIFIISHNTRSAGTLNISKNLIKYLNNSEEKIIMTLPAIANLKLNLNDNIKLINCYSNIFLIGFLNRILFDAFVIPFLILRYKPKKIIGIANYFINFFDIPSKLIIRHPYLLEDKNLKFLSIKEKTVEFLRNTYFKLSLKTSSVIFLQSNNMYNLFVAKYPKYKKLASILPNPISPYLENINKSENKISKNLIIYPSRYYPHKNHQFLLNIVKHNKSFFIENKIQFHITIDVHQKSSMFILKEIELNNLSNIVVNLGELSQENLVKHYKKCFAMIFPSQAETFGNGLIEGVFMNFPVIVPDLPYAQTILGEAGVYYKNNDEQSAFDEIKKLICDKSYYYNYVNKSIDKSKLYPNIEKWWNILKV